MKMRLNSRKKNNLGKTSISILFILVFYLFFNFFGDELKKNIISFKKNIDIYFLDKKKVLEENIFLKKEVEKERIKNIFSNYYFNRAKKLEERLGYLEKNNLDRKLYSVIYKDDWLYDSFILNNYSRNNLKEGDKVFYTDNFVIGKIGKVDKSSIRVDTFFKPGFVENYLIFQNGEVLYKTEGVGDSSGIIKLKLPRGLKPDKKAVLVLDDEEKSIVGFFLRDDFKSQKTEREVYFKVFYNPNTLTEVEI